MNKLLLLFGLVVLIGSCKSWVEHVKLLSINALLQVSDSTATLVQDKKMGNVLIYKIELCLSRWGAISTRTFVESEHKLPFNCSGMQFTVGKSRILLCEIQTWWVRFIGCMTQFDSNILPFAKETWWAESAGPKLLAKPRATSFVSSVRLSAQHATPICATPNQ